jgi:hypothetical protein
MDDGINIYPPADRHASSLLLPRKSPLVHGARSVRQGFPISQETSILYCTGRPRYVLRLQAA